MYSSKLLTLVLLGAASSDTVSAFGPAAANNNNRIHVRTRTGTRTTTSTSQPSPTALFLEDRIAALIDGELVREGRLKEWEAEFAAKNKQYLEPLSNPEAAESLLSRELGGGGSGGSSTGSSVAPDTINPMQFKRDKRLAEKDPQQYCADRCVATGNCEVYEDIYHLSPSQVMPFCTDCVLAEDEDAECSVDMLYDDDDTSDLRTKGELRP
jgi:hypothetical protein